VRVCACVVEHTGLFSVSVMLTVSASEPTRKAVLLHVGY